MLWTKEYDKLTVEVYEDRIQMGQAAARQTAESIRDIAARNKKVNMIFAAAPSQNEFLEALTTASDIPWEDVRGFHMDEYIGLTADAPQGFGNFLREKLFDRVPFEAVYYIDSQAASREECRRYSSLLNQNPPDIVCMGIGENGHIAFNDPHAARFDDPDLVKVVDLDGECRTQQVNDGCFSSIGEVPLQALTLTIPVLTNPSRIICVVPGPLKAQAVKAALEGPVEESCPASILRTRSGAVLYLDSASASLLTAGQ